MHAAFAQPVINVDKEITYAAGQYKGMLASHTDLTKFPQSLLPDGTPNNKLSSWW